MEEVVKFLKESGTFYLATAEANGQPHVRPFGAVTIFEGKVYIITNNQKQVYGQMIANPKIEISGMVRNEWIRLSAEAYPDDRREARAAMLEDNQSLSAMYHADDNLMAVFYLKNVTAEICSFTGEPKLIRF